MTTKTIEGLEQQVEQLVREHVAAQQRAVMAAVQRAFVSEVSPKREPSVRTGKQRRRRAGEISELQERLYQAVVAHAGETMTTIAAHVGQPPPTLNRPMFHLKREGRVRSAGQRHLTRYFPMLVAKSS
jgi:phosphoglycerate-specific signal transduction histidine kinase